MDQAQRCSYCQTLNSPIVMRCQSCRQPLSRFQSPRAPAPPVPPVDRSVTMTTPRTRLCRRRGWIAGVCSGLSAYLGVNVAFLRIMLLALVPFYGSGIMFYFGLSLFMAAPDVRSAGLSAEEARAAKRRSLLSYVIGALMVTAEILQGAGLAKDIVTNVASITSCQTVTTLRQR